MGTESETVDEAYVSGLASIGEIARITCHSVMSSNRKACPPPSSTWSHSVTEHVFVTLAYSGRASIRYGRLHKLSQCTDTQKWNYRAHILYESIIL